MKKNIIGIDIGGTTIKIGVFTMNGQIIHKWQIPTNKSEFGKFIVDDIWQSIMINLNNMNIDPKLITGIGVGAPGFIDGETGFIFEAVNIGWRNFALAEHLKKMTGKPVFVENDANVAALGENWLGAGNQAENLIAITLGTGVGGGIIVNGSILNGVNGTAGEIGHMTVDPDGYPCNCGRTGCLETIASATGIVRQAMAIIEKQPSSKLANYYKRTGKLSGKDVFDLAKNGDSDSEGIIIKTADLLGLVISNLAVILNPSKVLIGGGISKAGDQLLDYIKSSFDQYALPRVSVACAIKMAQLGNDAGIIGAASLVKNNLQY